MQVSGLAGFASGVNVAKGRERPEEAARDFEALLIGELLKSGRPEGGGWLSCGEDGSGESLVEMAEQQIAQVLAASGGLGLGSLVASGLREETNPSQPGGHEPAAGHIRGGSRE